MEKLIVLFLVAAGIVAWHTADIRIFAPVILALVVGGTFFNALTGRK